MNINYLLNGNVIKYYTIYTKILFIRSHANLLKWYNHNALVHILKYNVTQSLGSD